MLLQLTPNQISKHWDEVKQHLVYSLTPLMEVSEEALNNILKSLITGESQAWIITGDGEDQRTIYAMGVTCFSKEFATGTKNLLIYSLSGYRLIPEGLWQSALDGIKKFAKSEGCFRLIAYTRVERVLDISRLVGGNSETRLIYWEV